MLIASQVCADARPPPTSYTDSIMGAPTQIMIKQRLSLAFSSPAATMGCRDCSSYWLLMTTLAVTGCGSTAGAMTLFGRTGTNNVAACALSAESYTTAPSASLPALGRPAGLGRAGWMQSYPDADRVWECGGGVSAISSPSLLQPGPSTIHGPASPRCQPRPVPVQWRGCAV